MRDESVAQILLSHDSRRHYIIDLICFLIIGIGIGGYIMYWQINSVLNQTTQPTVQLAPTQTTTPKQNTNSGEGTINTPTTESGPQLKQI